jgi:uncharacterized protein (DUF1778 family)
MGKLKRPTTARTGRLSIRIDTNRKSVIAQAAKRQGATITDFVLDNAYRVASALLVDDGQLDLTKDQVAYVFDVLDNPPAKSVAAVRKLLTQPSVLDG